MSLWVTKTIMGRKQNTKSKLQKHNFSFVLYLIVFLSFFIEIESSQENLPFQSQVPTLHQHGENFGNTETKNQLPFEYNAQKIGQNSTFKQKSTNTGVKVEEILRQIFLVEFEEEKEIQNDDIESEEGENTKNKTKVNIDLATTEVDPILATSPQSNSRNGRAENNSNRDGQGRVRPGQKNYNRNGNRQKQTSGKRKNVGGNQINRKPIQGVENRPKPTGKGINLAKYNAYMDAVLGRMNTLIRKKRMDPLRVNLYAGGGPGTNHGNKNRNNKNGGGGKRNTKKKHTVRVDEDDSMSIDDSSKAFDDEDEDSSGEEDGRSIRHVTIGDSNVFRRRMRALLESINATKSVTKDEDSEIGGSTGNYDGGIESDEGRGKLKNVAKPNKNSGGNRKKEKTKIKTRPTKGGDDENVKQQTPPKKMNSPRPTRGILHGLSSLRRDGNVQIIKDGERARVIRARFLLGPVALEILPKKTKNKVGQSREELESSTSTSPPPAATATAPQLKGILEIRLSPGKPTRIRKLRVFPPGNIKVEGDKKNGGNPAMRRAGYRKVTPMATARLRQAAVQVVRQVDNKIKKTPGIHFNTKNT